MFQLKSNKLVPFSAQKLSNCLAAVNEVSPKGSKKLYCLFCKIQIFAGPHLGVVTLVLSNPFCLSDTNPSLFFFLFNVLSEKETEFGFQNKLLLNQILK